MLQQQSVMLCCMNWVGSECYAIWLYNRKLCGGSIESSGIYVVNRKEKNRNHHRNAKRNSLYSTAC